MTAHETANEMSNEKPSIPLSPPGTSLASRAQRFFNYLIDSTLVLVLLASILYVMIEFVLRYAGYEARDAAIPVILGLVPSLYFTGFEFFLGRTPGKFITRTRVVMATGKAIDLTAAIARTASRILLPEAVTFLTSKTPVGFHDKVSETRVIKM